MTVTLSDIKDTLRGAIGRGAALDTELVNFVRRALRHVERKKNWPGMLHLNTVQNDLDAEYPRTLLIPNREVRSIVSMQITHEQESGVTDWTELSTKITLNKAPNPQYWNPPLVGYPSEYRLAQKNLIIFNNTPEKIYRFAVEWYEYSLIPDEANARHWLFDDAQEIIEDLATYYAAKKYRDYPRADAIMKLLQPQIDDLVGQSEDEEHADSEIVMQQDFYPRTEP